MGRNPNFMKLIDNKPHILVLNKSDLCDIDRTVCHYNISCNRYFKLGLV